MKAFYTCSTSFKLQEGNEFYKKTINYLGFKVGQKNLKINQHNTAIGENDRSEIIKAVHLNEKSIKECEIFIADITDGSSDVGFEIALALAEKKPVLALRHKTDMRTVSYGSIASEAHKDIKYVEYETVEDITKIVDEFLEEAKNKIDTKFILIIPSEIDKYLSWASDYRRMHKAQVVRDALDGVMKKDKDWREYQKQISN